MTKTILITGSTDGIGKLAAIQLAKEGHAVYLHGRNSGKLKQVVEEVKKQSGNEKVEGFVADFSDRAAVLQLAEKVCEQLSALDVLINNAGVFNSPLNRTADGVDIRFAVNYFAPYLLTAALIPLLRKASNSRIINLSSAAQAPVAHPILTGSATVSAQEAYAQSKLALTMWSFYLAKSQADITVVAVNPGSLLNINMVREAFGRYWSSADKGANILTELATSEVYQNADGKYFDNDQGAFGKAHPDAYNASKIDSLITATETIISAK